MKKVWVILFMILILSPFQTIKGYSPTILPGGIIIRTDDCDTSNGRSPVYFDILVKREEVPSERLSSSISEDYYFNKIKIGYEGNEELLDFDNEWISYSAYVLNSDDNISRNFCETIFEVANRNIVESSFSEFKLVVFSLDGDLLYTSSAISSGIMLNEDNDEYRIVVYDFQNISIELELNTYVWPKYSGFLGVIYFIMWFLRYVLVATFVVAALLEMLRVYRVAKDKVLTGFLFLLNVGAFGSYFIFHTMDSVILMILAGVIILGIMSARYFLIFRSEDDYSKELLSFVSLNLGALVLFSATLL